MDEPVYGAVAWEIIQKSFQHVKGLYFDHAASTLYSQAIIESSLTELVRNNFGNPHSRNAPSRLTSDLIDQTRAEVLEFFHADPSQYSLIFTSGATESLRIVAESFRFQNVNKGSFLTKEYDESGSFVYLKESHTSVIGMREYLKEHIPCYALPTDHIFASLSNYKVIDTLDAEQTNNGHADTEYAGSVTKRNSSSSLFVFPAQCNFSGFKYPLELISMSQQGAFSSINQEYCINKEVITTDQKKTRISSTWYCLLDAASYAGTNFLDLSIWKPDIVAVSFYKIFGFPTGVGGLIIHKRAYEVLHQKYFGGGTVEFVLSSRDFHMARNSLQEKFENGTSNFLSILSLRFGLRELKRMVTSMEKVSIHTFELGKLLFTALSNMKYRNGRNLAKIYSYTDFSERKRQGGILSFNLLTDRGDFIGYAQVEKIFSLHDVHVRTGCFCNPGACQRFLQLSDEDLQLNFLSGHKCGDENDLIDGRPTGAVRVSFGYMSSKAEVVKFIEILQECFLKEKSHDFFQETSIEDSLKPSSVINLTKINVYPIKSCGAFSPKCWPLTKSGLLYDRYWIIVNEAGAALTQKREPKLCKIRPEIDITKGMLTLRWHDTQSTISTSIDLLCEATNEKEIESRLTKVGGKIKKFVDCYPQVNIWLSDVLNQPGLRLLKCTDVRSPVMNDSSFMLLNRKSADAFEQSFSNMETLPLSAEDCLTRFRGNFEVDGLEAFEEDKCSQVKIGTIIFKNVGPCFRCQMICIDQNTAIRRKEALSALIEFRGKKMPFGIRLELKSPVSNESVIQIDSDVIFENVGDE